MNNIEESMKVFFEDRATNRKGDSHSNGLGLTKNQSENTLRLVVNKAFQLDVPPEHLTEGPLKTAKVTLIRSSILRRLAKLWTKIFFIW